MLRLITEQKISPEEAVRAYHGVLQAKGIKPKLSLEKDLEVTDQTMSYDGGQTRRSSVAVRNNPLAVPRPATETDSPSDGVPHWPKLANGAPDFSQMDPLQRLAYDRARLSRKFR